MAEYNYPLTSSALKDSTNAASQLADGARELVCWIYSQYPSWAINSGIATPIKSLYDTVCGSPPTPVAPLPPAPSVPFTGGQCVGEAYCVTIRHRSVNTNYPWFPERTYEICNADKMGAGLSPILGAISGLFMDFERGQKFNDGSGRYGYVYVLKTTSAEYVTLNNGVYFGSNFQGFTAGTYTDTMTLVSVRKVSGADNCGNPPLDYPPNTPPPNVDTRNIIINNNDGTNLTVPLFFVRPTFSLNPNIKVNFNLNPQFNGTINFDFGGINVDFGGGGSEGSEDILNELNLLKLELDDLNLNFNNFKLDFDNYFNNNNNNYNDLGDLKLEIDNLLNITNNLNVDIGEVQLNLTNNFNLNLDIQQKLEETNDKLDEGVNCKIETEIIEVNNSDFDEDYDWQFSTTSVEVPKVNKPITQLLFNELSEVKEYAGRPRSTCSGVPIESYDLPTVSCAVLYYSKYLGNQENFGRYINIPNPNLDAIKQWANSDRQYTPGNFLKYIRFVSARGNKIQVYGENAQLANDQTYQLLGLTNYTAEDIYFDAPVREVTERRSEQLKLKYVTYYPDNSMSKRGRQGGTIIWRSPNIRG